MHEADAFPAVKWQAVLLAASAWWSIHYLHDYPHSRFSGLPLGAFLLFSLVLWGSTESQRQEEAAFFVIVGQLSAVSALIPGRDLYLLYVLGALGLPMVCLFTVGHLVRDQARVPLCGLIILLALAGDYFYSFAHSGALFAQRAPGTIPGVDTHCAATVPVTEREIRPWYPHKIFRDQSIRDLPTLYRKSYVFSPALSVDSKSPSFEQALSQRRWNSILLSRPYFELIHRNLPVGAFEEVFAVHRNTFQWKQAATRYPFASFAGAELADYLREHVLMESPPASLPHPASSTAKVQLTSFRRNSVELDVHASGPGVLYWSDGFHPAWQATLDGKPTPLSLANFAFKAVLVPAGAHHLRFTFSPILFLCAQALFFIVFSVAVAVGIGLRLRESFADRRFANATHR